MKRQNYSMGKASLEPHSSFSSVNVDSLKGKFTKFPSYLVKGTLFLPKQSNLLLTFNARDTKPPVHRFWASLKVMINDKCVETASIKEEIMHPMGITGDFYFMYLTCKYVGNVEYGIKINSETNHVIDIKGGSLLISAIDIDTLRSYQC
jgi:hypothetical protein